MLDWNDRPLRQKLTLVILFTCSVALLLACTCLSIYQILEYRTALLNDVTALADVVSKNTQAALAFDDEGAAQQTLSSLQAEPSVAAAEAAAETGGAAETRAAAAEPGGAADVLARFPVRSEAIVFLAFLGIA